MTSESQERMLAIVTPEQLDEVLEICGRWDVRASVIGTVTTGGRLRILSTYDGEVLCDLQASTLHEDAPNYDRPMAEPAGLAGRRAETPPAGGPDAQATLLGMITDLRWVWSQYDHQLLLNTVAGPDDGATLLRLKHPRTGVDTGRGLAITADGNHRWCAVDPRQGAANLIAEATLNVACVGATPKAMVDCMNFGNPEHPEVMWQLSGAIDGMAEACRALSVPCVGGNVSLYNESKGTDIDPSPVVAVLGVVDSLTRRPPGGRLVDGGGVYVLGPSPVSLAGTRWAWARGWRGGTLDAVDYDVHRQVCQAAVGLVDQGIAAGVTDVSEGGLALAVAEMAVRSGVGASLGASDLPGLFGEGPSRIVVCVAPAHEAALEALAAEHGVAITRLGAAGGDRLTIGDDIDVSLAELTGEWRDRLPAALSHGVSQ